MNAFSALRKVVGVVAVVGIASAAVLTLLSFGLVFAGFAEPLGSGSGEWLNHAGASCFALSRFGWVLALIGGGAYAALAYTQTPSQPASKIADILPADTKPRAGAAKRAASQPDKLD
jgi:hypothetical protein